MYIRQSVAVAWFMDAALYPIFSSLPPYLANAAPSSSSSSPIRPNYTCVHLCAFTSLEIASVISPPLSAYTNRLRTFIQRTHAAGLCNTGRIQKQTKKISVENFQCFPCITKLANVYNAINSVLRYMANSLPRGSLRRVASASSSSSLLYERYAEEEEKEEEEQFWGAIFAISSPSFRPWPRTAFPPLVSFPFHDSATVFIKML